MTSRREHFLAQLAAFMLLTMLAVSSIAPRAWADLGDRVVNIATVSHETAENNRITQTTNEAVFIIEALPTPSTIEFFRYAPASGDNFSVRFFGSDYSPSGDGSDFTPIGDPVTSNGVVLDFSGPVPLAPAEAYLSGELMIVRVIDEGQNGDPSRIETVSITVTADNGDTITLRLYESGPDTGEFFAYVPSTRTTTPQNDNTLTAPANTTLTATYVDAFDSTEVSVDTALVDPFCRIFDSLTGELIDGAVVTIIDASTGQPATVFGVDGVSSFPSTITSGTTIIDSSGLEYPQDSGEFLFPLLLPGEYRLEVAPPPQYFYPSSVAENSFSGLQNAPYTIIDGSYAREFTIEDAGTPSFDVPLDPAAEIVLTKEPSIDTAAAGDFVGYTIRVENRDPVPAPLRVIDELPPGFRYETNSAMLNGQRVDNPTISSDGRTLTFSGGIVAPGDFAILTYITNVTAGVPVGTAVNSAIAVNNGGERISNRTEAAVYIREDLLRSRLTIVGRVAENACEADDDWARDLQDGKGVENVRLYMETGEYVVTDEDGLYHFENVKPGTHVVQIDTETLPPGYEPMVCEENSRYAHSAISKFVDAQGGTVWRANFYLKRTEETEVLIESAMFDDRTEYLDYQESWLDRQTDEVEWVYPQPERTPSARSVNVGIKHGVRDTVRLSLNGRDVPGLNYTGRDIAATKTAAISRWRGVDILEGRNEFKAEILNATGDVTQTLYEVIWFNADAERASIVADRSVLVADGRTPPVVAVRVENNAGRPVHAGRVLSIDIEGDYRLKTDEQFENESAVTARVSERQGAVVGPDGVALVELEPTLQTGRLRLTVKLDSGRTEEIDAYLKPEKRDWILVGLADGTLGVVDADGDGGSEFGVNTGADALNDGRVAFFAKGVIKGEFLLTLAVDTAKRRGSRDQGLFNDIDPNAYYTLYGDRTFQDHEAESRYPVYVKLEKETFFALFGDYDTNLNETELGRYSRRLSGVKAVHEGEKFSVSAFAAETNQGFQREELAADGTSGPYQLSNREILRNSETIVIETRDRFRPDQIIERRTMTRFSDYEIDYELGTIIFRHPVNASDTSFNPRVIVAEYETSADSERNVTAGGRVAVRFNDGRIEIGGTYIHEDGSDTSANAKSELFGVDVTLEVDEDTEIRAEYATTDTSVENGDDVSGDAYLIEAVREKENYTVNAYLREDGDGFGLGQQSSATQGVRRVGVTGSALLTESVGEETNLRTERFFDAQAYREENLGTDQSRDVAEVSLRQESALLGISGGLRAVEEDLGSDGKRNSVLLTGSARKAFPDKGLTLSLTHEEPISGEDESSLFPQRTIFGLDKTLTELATLNVRHERQNGANASGSTTVAGITMKPWTGGELRLAADSITQDSGQRLGATVGVDQSVQIDEKWSATLGMTHRTQIDGDETPLDPLADVANSPIEVAPQSALVFDEAYTATYAGVGYVGETAAGSARVEARDAATSQRYAGIFGAAREASERFSYAGAARVQYETNEQPDGSSTDRRQIDVRVGTAFRPRGEGVVAYNRFDVKHEEVFGQSKAWKVVNNLGANFMLSDRTQMSLNHGIKYGESEINGVDVEGLTQLAGVEVRHDISKRWDVGIHASALVNHATDTVDYAWGPSVGVSPAKNVWMSVGYNVDGYSDQDFEAAEFSRKGAYLKLRIKFDQTTASELLDRISPKSSQ